MLEEAWAPEYTYIGVIVDTKTIQDLQVSLNTISTTCRHIIKNTFTRTVGAHARRHQMGYRRSAKVEDQAGGMVCIVHSTWRLTNVMFVVDHHHF